MLFVPPVLCKENGLDFSNPFGCFEKLFMLRPDAGGKEDPRDSGNRIEHGRKPELIRNAEQRQNDQHSLDGENCQQKLPNRRPRGFCRVDRACDGRSALIHDDGTARLHGRLRCETVNANSDIG